MTQDLECPYCGAGQECNHDDGYGYEENKTYQQECDFCGKTFAYSTSIIFHHETWQAPCLNEGDHEWKSQFTVPMQYTKMRCTKCDESRKPDEKEWSEIVKEHYQSTDGRK